MPDVGGRIGPYELLERIDVGPRSEVFHARHRVLDTRCALKILHPRQPERTARALIETARLQATIVHPNVVRVLDAGLFEDRPFVVSEWIDGWTLVAWVNRYGTLPAPMALKFLRGVVRGVMALHEQRIVHRDLNPTNVLVDKRLNPRVNDMALAKRLVPGQGRNLLSVEYSTLGTPEYMAPEQIKDAGSVDTRADLWTLGVLLYELVCKDVPFHGDTAQKTLWQVMQGRYVPMRERKPDVPEAVEALCAELLRVDPDERLASAAELSTRIDQITG
ncbi:MAG: serine/threonine-protein kinase [Myxococcota bacterium]